MGPHGHGPHHGTPGRTPHGHGPDDGTPGHTRHEHEPGHIVTTGGHEHERLFPPPLVPGDPGPQEIEGAGRCECAAYKPDEGRWRHLSPAENPKPKGSFGYVGSFAELAPEPDGGPTAGTLFFPIHAEKLQGVARETLRVFRWDAGEEDWELVARSALGQDLRYVWARVAASGIYCLIGIHSDPLIARSLALSAVLRGWLELPPGGFGSRLAEKLCAFLLCDPEARRALGDPELYRALVEDNRRLGLPGRWIPESGGKPQPPALAIDPCAICTELEVQGLDPPEMAMLSLSIGTPADVGQWALVTPVPAAQDNVLAVHAALLRTGKVLYFGGSENVGAQNAAGSSAIDNTRQWDPATGAIEVLASPPRYDLFCCGHAFLADGGLLAAGGTRSWGGIPHPGHGTNFEGLRNAAVFDPAFSPGSNPWTDVARLCPERGETRGGGSWYPTLLTLPNGRVLRMAGPPEFEDSHHNNRMLEVFNPAAGKWNDQGPVADLPIGNAQDLPQYPRLHVLPDGRVFCATPMEGPLGGPGFRSWFWNTATKAWSPAGSGPAPVGAYVGFDTSSVLLPLRRTNGYAARVLYTNRPDPQIIDLSAATPVWQSTSPRALSDPVTGPPVRYHATTVILPDATVLVIGGHSDPNSWDPPVLAVERFDPVSETWSVLATAAVPRVYHSVALLLPDGRVWTAGSDYGGGSHEPRMELYSPPYLFAGPRPTLASAPDVVTLGSSFQVSTPDAPSVQTVALVRCGSATHAFNADQRWLDLHIEATLPGGLTLAAPPNTNVAPPGHYMLFLLEGNGVPSIAKIVRVQATTQPTISSLSPRSGPSGGGTPVEIHGTNFQPGATVSFGGVAATAVGVASENALTATAPALAPGALHDVVVTNPDLSTATRADGWLADFLDVPAGHLFHEAIQRLFRGGVTAGCGGGNFCPADSVTRAQMAVFLMRAEHGSGWTAPAVTGGVFTDVTAATFGAGAIEQAASEGIFASGGTFGPNAPVDRAEMAELLLKAEHGPGYVPAAASGVFLDVPAADPAAPWIERLFQEGITSGCGGGNFCPHDTSTRGQMAVFLVKTFGLP